MNETQLLATHSGVAALLAAGISVGKIQKNPYPGGRDFVLLPQANGDVKVEYIERPELPARRTGATKVNDTESFIAGVNRYVAPARTVLYASLHPASFVAVLNDHNDKREQSSGHDGANWRDHRVEFLLANSKECKLWHEAQKRDMTQEDFAFFIENNLPDFKNPEGGRMLEIALNFRVKNNLSYRSALKLQDGSVDLQYTEQVEGGAGKSGNAKVPETFTIDIPVWDGLEAKKYVFEVRLRYRVNNGQLAIRYELVRPHKVVEQAFRDVLEQVKKGVKDVPIIFGAAG
jgi:uncharacterized protein YfdQ (DUF2303 family)